MHAPPPLPPPMSPSLLLTIALFVAGIGAGVFAYWVRRNDATTSEVLTEVKQIGAKLDKVHQTVFGPNNDNGLYGDNAHTKKSLHRTNGFIAGVSLFLGIECDEKGGVRMLDGESLLERRMAERRSGRERRES